MKILLVEDNNEKSKRILSRLIEDTDISRDDVTVVFTGMDARKSLRDDVYDLMILDIILPLRGGDPPTSATAEGLLTEQCDRRTMKKPRQIIGLTAFDEGLSALEPIFSQQMWTIVKYSPDSMDWGDQLVNAVCWLSDAENEVAPLTYNVDVAIITALSTPEYDAVMRNGWGWGAPQPIDDTTFVSRATFESDGKTYNAVSAYCPKMGLVSAALISAKLIAATRPKFIVMAGICAGVKGRANYGDPVIADPCWDWQRGKHVFKEGEHAFEMRPEQIPLGQEIRARWEQLKADKAFWREMKDQWPGAPDTELRLKLGPSVSGASVLADPGKIEEVKRQHGSLLAVEMESYAVLSAASLAANPRPIAFSCKSVCDFADEHKNDQWQTYAAYTSAKAIGAFFERYMASLDP